MRGIFGMEDFKKRLLEFCTDYLCLSQTSFEDACGLPHGTFTSIKVKGPSVSVLMKIADTYPNLNMNWLISGRGEMLIGDKTPTPPPSLSINTINTVNIGNWGELVELLNKTR